MRTGNHTILYTNYMRWEPLRVPNSIGKAWIKTLAKDEATSARTALVKFDPGFRQERTTSNLPADTYVLEGDMLCGDLRFEPDTFYYRPGGSDYGPIETKNGVTRLVWTVDNDRESSSEPVFIEDCKQLPHEAHHLDPELRSLGGKTLRQDHASGVSIRIHEMWDATLRGLPGVQHVHDHCEEFFMLKGEFWDYLEEIDGHVHMVPGSYACRRPFESSHGDMSVLAVPESHLIRLDLHGAKASFNPAEYGRDLEIHSPERPVPEAVAFVE